MPHSVYSRSLHGLALQRQVLEVMAAAGFPLRPGSVVVGSLMIAAGKAGQGASVQVGPSPEMPVTHKQMRVGCPALAKGG